MNNLILTKRCVFHFIMCFCLTLSEFVPWSIYIFSLIISSSRDVLKTKLLHYPNENCALTKNVTAEEISSFKFVFQKSSVHVLAFLCSNCETNLANNFSIIIRVRILFDWFNFLFKLFWDCLHKKRDAFSVSLSEIC